MFCQYWAKVRFLASSSSRHPLAIYPQASGSGKSYVLESSEQLALFSYLGEDHRLSVTIPQGKSEILEVIILTCGEELSEGFQWSIYYTPEELLGRCELIELLGRWENEADEPSEIRNRAGLFSRI
ncbi:hypothetical protein OPU71_21165 [Niveibacterium sp. 24ML]|uniref:hypothetical protein n=1 Tax=Niveibacterium sp. 24ML TaxID=2985512 RepID=UPI0022706462|nr:hypothetical protein [Niveibacterium sp. 24ML]MCX9158632.1 hypothetical protein [Niveibacterium sp. 24ML]